MVAGIFHQGSGLGNQLHRYVATRVLALDKGYDFSIVAPENFKGKDFMDLDMGVKIGWPYTVEQPSGKVVPLIKDNTRWEENTPYYNPEFNFIEDNTIIDGEFQDERYFDHRLDEVDEWLKVEPLKMPDNLCIIGFRGGEFALYPDLFLPMKYWVDAVDLMLKENPKMEFRIVTDDPELAKSLFPYEVTHEIGMDWRQCRYAKYSIISNSSFYILPRLLKHHDWDDMMPWAGLLTIAPRYWDRYNIKKWERPYNYYKNFTYI